jgi:hypothetical protein
MRGMFGSSLARPRARFDTWEARAKAFALLVALVVAIGSSVAHAEPVVREARIESARGMALGTGMRANGLSTQAQADHPANLPFGGLYHIESFSGYQPNLKRIVAGGSVVDSMTSRLAAGLSARGLFGDNEAGDNSGWEGRLSLGLPLAEIISVGVAGRYANFTVSDPKARAEHPPGRFSPADHTYKLKAFTMDASVSVRPIEGLSIAALAYNLIETDSPLAPMLVGGGLAFGKNGFSAGGEVLADLNTQHLFVGGPKLQMGGGFEFLAQGIAPFRVGYMYDQGRHQHSVTGGLGYMDRSFGAQFSVRQVVTNPKDTTIFSVVQYFIQN